VSDAVKGRHTRREDEHAEHLSDRAPPHQQATDCNRATGEQGKLYVHCPPKSVEQCGRTREAIEDRVQEETFDLVTEAGDQQCGDDDRSYPAAPAAPDRGKDQEAGIAWNEAKPVKQQPGLLCRDESRSAGLAAEHRRDIAGCAGELEGHDRCEPAGGPARDQAGDATEQPGAGEGDNPYRRTPSPGCSHRHSGL